MRGTPRHMARAALGAAWRQFTPSALTILLFLREIPGHAGQCHDGLAGSRCGCSGQPVCVISPWVAGLGAWLTGSNLRGAAMFALLPEAAASRTGLYLLWCAR